MYSIIWPAGATQNGCKTLKMTISTERIKIHTFVSFHFVFKSKCIYTYTVRTYIIMSEMKICIMFPFNGLYIIPLPLSASVQAHANFVQPKRIQIIHCTLDTQIQLHSVSKLDIALVFFPGLSTPALCSLCSPQRVSGFFFNF